MFNNNNNNNRILVSEPFSDRYTLLIDSKMMAGNVSMNSKTRMRWDFNVHRVKEDYLEISLLQLENTLIESDNPMIKDISAMSQAFGRMYSELHLIISHTGKVLEVLNMDLILDKWNIAKKEMEKAIEHSPEAKDILILNDEIFNDKEKVKLAIGANDFLNLYFPYVYGKSLPYTNGDIITNNFLNSNTLQWKTKVSAKELDKATGSLLLVDVSSEPHGILTKSWHQKTYKSFEKVMDIKKLETTLSKKAQYTVSKNNGKLLEVTSSNIEIADKEKLFTVMNYKMVADHKDFQTNSEQKSTKDYKENSGTKRSGRMSFLIDDM
ncbi:hypothetical protein [Psychroserpens sp. NJDZ02]|uniref:hypothetical protein n=1 Tax=Psychroserpens sp. NJDZ02 TaxID=2570561 RepID=UPI0010A8B1ED|nr:hypothetical protein [Psychroserpens sp. NJDZ02]QCE42985.1 hypothetical protein E9099_16705 [Psychroserpens sp. NJDZ02]